MKKTEGQHQVELPGVERPARVIVRRVGQQPPSLGDGVIAEATIILPAEDGRLIPDLRFEGRVILASEGLSSWWGGGWCRKENSKNREFAASTWSIAFEEAHKWADKELSKLIQALKERIKALEDAED